MKKLLFGISALLLLTACSPKDDEAYESNINKGLEAVAEDNFGKAEALFEIALEANPEATAAKVYIQQIELIKQAEEAVEDDEIEEALKALDQAIDKKDGSKVISAKAKDQKEKLVALQKKEAEEKEKVVVKAEAEEASNVKQAVETKPVASRKNEYLQKLSSIEAGLSDLDYLYQNGITSEMLEGESITYERWDQTLNEIYGVLKTQLSANEMNALKQKQRQWVTTRDNTASAEASEFAGGTMESVQYVNTQARFTKERCYELVYNYMK